MMTHQIWGVAVAECAAWHKSVICLGNIYPDCRSDKIAGDPNIHSFKLVYPKAISRSPPAPEVPKEFSTDYSEACLVFPDSEKASAALNRRCLQHLLRETAGIDRGDLANEVQQVLDSKQLPHHLAENLDGVRSIGNFAAHPIKGTNTGEIVDMEPIEAEWLLNILEQLFDFYFVQPARSRARREFPRNPRMEPTLEW